MNEKNMVGGISLETWKKAFAELAANAIDHDDFSDILFFDLYPQTIEETNEIEDDDIACDIFNEKWEFVDEAFKAIFGVDRNLV